VQQRRIDIKAHWSPPVGDPPQLLVERDKAENGDADVFVKAQVWNSEWTVIHGWTTREHLLDEGWIEEWEQENWTMTVGMLRPISELRGWMTGVGWQW